MFMGVLSSHWTYEERKECRTVMLVGSRDKWEPGLTPVPSQLRKTVSPIEILALGRIQTHSFSTVFIVTPETGLDGLDRLQTVNIEGLLGGNQHSAYDKPPSNPKSVRTVLQP